MTFLFIAALLIQSAQLGPPASRIPRKLSEGIAAYDRAQVEGNGQALNSLLASDYLLVNSGGIAEDKVQFIGDLTAPGYRLDPYVVRHPLLRVWSGGAVAGGVAMLNGIESGKPFSACLRFADVWRLRQGKWQVIFSQASRATPSECKPA